MATQYFDMAIKIKKHKIPFDTWNAEKWALFYKELILCENRLYTERHMDNYTYGLILTDMYFKYPNFSHWSRVTRISRSSIAHAVYKTIDYFTHIDSNI